MTNLPRISLVTPSFNSAATIERTICSVQNQHYPNLQYICIDGGSTDGTTQVIEKYSELIDYFVSEPDKNAADAINKGFIRANGSIFCYLNADDELMPGILHQVATYFEQNPDIHVITGKCKRVYEDGSEVVTTVRADYYDNLSSINLLEQPSTFWRSSLYKQAGEFDSTYYYAFDWEMWNRFKATGARFMAVDDIFSVYHFSDSNLTSRAGKKVVDEMYRAMRKYGPYRGLLAYVYLFLFHVFDMNGYYDVPFADLPPTKQKLFGATLKVLYAIFGKEKIDPYNWTWASKQIRGVVWYK